MLLVWKRRIPRTWLVKLEPLDTWPQRYSFSLLRSSVLNNNIKGNNLKNTDTKSFKFKHQTLSFLLPILYSLVNPLHLLLGTSLHNVFLSLLLYFACLRKAQASLPAQDIVSFPFPTLPLPLHPWYSAQTKVFLLAIWACWFLFELQRAHQNV